jgi:hypothetical protein
MTNREIFVFTTALLIAAAMLYRKYFKKDKGKYDSHPKKPSGTKFLSSSEDEAYEPYTKKNEKEQDINS